MLRPPLPKAFSETDLQIFACLIPLDHYLRRACRAVDFEGFRPALACCYSPDQGRPAEDPVRMLKLEFLQYHDNLSDQQVIARAQTDVAYRCFLDLGMNDLLPEPSTLCYFRGRLGVEGHRGVFHELVAQARAAGLVKDRLRIKDATHVIADVAIPTTLALLARVRQKLLAAARAFDPLRVEGEVARAETIHASTEGRNDEDKLVARVSHLREILNWVDQLQPPEEAAAAAWQALLAARQLAHKILADQENPEAGNRTRSVVDPDARRGKHGDWYDGYLLDVMMDADSELITAVNVLPGNGDEAADAAELVRQEQAAQGNDIQALSIDGVAFQGPVLRELQEPEGLALDVYVPPPPETPTASFGPEQFSEDPERQVVTCPAGQTSTQRFRNDKNTAWVYRFRRETCQGCALLNACMGKLPQGSGRTVHKNDYEAEYRRMREKAQTAEYEAVRREHPKIERKLSQLVRRHGARRARYRGLWKVLYQALMKALVVNVRRFVHLLCARRAAATA